MKPLILLIEANETASSQLRSLLTADFQLTVVDPDGLEQISEMQPDIILLDQSCDDLISQIRSTERHIPILMLVSSVEGEEERELVEAGIDDYLLVPPHPQILQKRLSPYLAQSFQEVSAILRIAQIAHKKDGKTPNQAERMGHFSRILGLASGMGEAQANLLIEAAPLNDIGKLAIPEQILNKKGRLTADEFSLIKSHCQSGADLIGDSSSPMLQMAKTIALTHHEKWNGSGYPHALKGKEIPLVGRIVAIADIFEALISKRPYKEAWEIKDAVKVIQSSAGEYLDPELVDLFMRELPSINDIINQYPDS